MRQPRKHTTAHTHTQTFLLTVSLALVCSAQQSNPNLLDLTIGDSTTTQDLRTLRTTLFTQGPLLAINSFTANCPNGCAQVATANGLLDAITTRVSSITNDLMLRGNISFSLKFPNVLRVNGSITISSRQIRTLDLTNLTHIEGSLTMTECNSFLDDDLTETFGSLRNIGGRMYLRNVGRSEPGGDIEFAELISVGGVLDIHDGLYGTLAFPLLERTGGFIVWRQVLLRHFEAPSLQNVSGDILFQQLMQLHTLCHFGLPESGFTGRQIQIVGTPGLTMMAPWLATAAGVRNFRECNMHRPVLIRTEQENLVNLKIFCYNPVIVSWANITEEQLQSLLGNKRNVGSLFLENLERITRLDTILGSAVTIAGGMILDNLPLITCELPMVRSIGAQATFTRLNVALISIPWLESIGDRLHVSGLRRLNNMSFPRLTSVNGSIFITDLSQLTSATLSQSFRALRTVQGSMDIRSLARRPSTFYFASLYNVSGNLQIWDGVSTSLRFPRLAWVGRKFMVWRQAQLLHFSALRLTYVGGEVHFQDLRALTSLCNFSLPQAGFSTSNEFKIIGCNNLRMMEPWMALAADHLASPCESMPPSASPTMPPTQNPTISPSVRPTMAPSMYPSRFPSREPSSEPSLLPSSSPHTTLPTIQPSGSPVATASAIPTHSPSPVPTVFPVSSQPTASLPTVDFSPQKNQSTGSDDATTLGAVIGVAVLAIIGAVALALFLVKRKGSTSDRDNSVAFDNPMYDSSPSAAGELSETRPVSTGGYMDITPSDSSGNTDVAHTHGSAGYMDIAPTHGSTGYMDVALPTHGSSGYMDVAYTADDDEEEDV